MLKHLGEWYHHYDKAILPLISSVSGSVLIYFQPPAEISNGWYEAFKIVLAVCGTLALAFFTFYYKKQSETEKLSVHAIEELKKSTQEDVKHLRRDLEEDLQKLEARLTKEILSQTLPVRDQAAAALLEVAAEKNKRLTQHIRYLQLFILVREAIAKSNCDELNITDIFKDPNV